MVLRVAGTTPADTSPEASLNPDYYDDDLFVPFTDKENFDVFDWQLCKVRVRCFIVRLHMLRTTEIDFEGLWIGILALVHRLVTGKDHNVPKTDTVSETLRSFENKNYEHSPETQH